MKNRIRIAVIPIDNRPICYDIVKDTLALDENIELFMPPIETLGGLTTQSDINKIFEFLKSLTDIDYLIVALDTIAYGGLVPSRRCEDKIGEIKKRIDDFKDIAKDRAKKILAFSSIMRISNNDINEEEKEYWAQWGKKIFEWSFNKHRLVKKAPKTDIPKEILKDYINTRKRNFDINKYYIQLAAENFFDTLIFSKDDCAQFGLNVLESQELQQDAFKLKNVLVKTGADEIPLALITRALTKGKPIAINPVFLEDKSIDLVSKYEDISIKNCVLAQVVLSGCKVETEGELTLLVNNFKKEQGDLVLGSTVNHIENKVKFPSSPYFIADVNNANGADDVFVQQIFKQKTNNFYGYSGYNTSANTLGSAIFCAIVKYLALKKKSYNDEAFKRCQFIRFLDDWGYQALVRKFIRDSEPKFQEALHQKEDELNINAQKISKFIGYSPNKIKYSLPWKRSFEIRINPEKFL